MHKRTLSSEESTVAKFLKVNESSLKLKNDDIPSTSREAVPHTLESDIVPISDFDIKEEFISDGENERYFFVNMKFVDMNVVDSVEVSANSEIREDLGQTLVKPRLKELPLTARPHLERMDMKVVDSVKVSANSEIREDLGQTLDKPKLKKLPLTAKPRLERMATQPTVNDSGNATALQQILASLGRVESRQEEISKRLSVLESTLAMMMPKRFKLHAKQELLRKCKVLFGETQSSVFGDSMSDEQILLLNMLPISSDETLLKVEEHLKDKAYTDAMADIIFQLKSSKKIIEKVMKSLFSDELVSHYNCDGKAGKKPLIILKTVNLVLAAFASVHIDKISAIKRYVSLSHNRFKHIKRNLKKTNY